MSAGAQAIAAKPRQAPMSGFERYLTLWVALCIVAGVALGQGLPDVFQAIGRMEVAQVNLPVGLLIWVMIVPMLVKIDFGALHQVKEHWRGIGVTLFVNWAVKPFSMALLGWLFIRQVFAPFLPADQLDSYIAGLILLASTASFWLPTHYRLDAEGVHARRWGRRRMRPWSDMRRLMIGPQAALISPFARPHPCSRPAVRRSVRLDLCICICKFLSFLECFACKLPYL